MNNSFSTLQNLPLSAHTLSQLKVRCGRKLRCCATNFTFEKGFKTWNSSLVCVKSILHLFSLYSSSLSPSNAAAVERSSEEKEGSRPSEINWRFPHYSLRLLAFSRLNCDLTRWTMKLRVIDYRRSKDILVFSVLVYLYRFSETRSLNKFWVTSILLLVGASWRHLNFSNISNFCWWNNQQYKSVLIVGMAITKWWRAKYETWELSRLNFEVSSTTYEKNLIEIVYWKYFHFHFIPLYCRNLCTWCGGGSLWK